MVNYNDVAKLSKVSTSTVSHVLNKTRFVSPEKVEKVMKAVKELNYKPNLLARSLATGRTHTAGLIVSDIDNPFFPEIIRGVEEYALSKDYYIFLCNTDYNVEKGIKYIKALIQKMVDGIIIDSCLADNFFLIDRLMETDMPIVIIDWNESNIDADRLVFNFKPGTKEAVEYLVSLEHKKIYYVTGPENLSTADIRKKYFLECIDNWKSLIEHKIFYGNFKYDGGVKVAKEMIENNAVPTAVMCANDLTALGIMKTFESENINIPDDVSIIGLDNIKMSELVKPTLTTLEYKKHIIGEIAMKMLINRIKDKNIPIQKEYFTAKLIKRGSTSKAKDN